MNTRIRKKRKLLKHDFSKKEVYSAGLTASEYLYALIRKFRYADKYGYPYDLTSRKWDEVLDAMLWSFDQIRRDYSGSPDPLVFETKEEYHQAMAEYNSKLEQGLGYFAKYIHDLWD